MSGPPSLLAVSGTPTADTGLHASLPAPNLVDGSTPARITLESCVSKRGAILNRRSSAFSSLLRSETSLPRLWVLLQLMRESGAQTLDSLLHVHGCLATLCENLEKRADALDSLLALRTNSRMYDATATTDVKTSVFVQNRKHRLNCRAQLAVAWAIVEVLSVATLTRQDCLVHRLPSLLGRASLLRASPKPGREYLRAFVAACDRLTTGGDDTATLRFCAGSSSTTPAPVALSNQSQYLPAFPAAVPMSQSASTPASAVPRTTPPPQVVDPDDGFGAHIDVPAGDASGGGEGSGSLGSVVPPPPAKRQSLTEYMTSKGGGGGDLVALLQQTRQMVEAAPPKEVPTKPRIASPPLVEAPASPDLWGDGGSGYNSDDVGVDIVPHVVFGADDPSKTVKPILKKDPKPTGHTRRVRFPDDVSSLKAGSSGGLKRSSSSRSGSFYFDLPAGLSGVTPEEEDYLHEILTAMGEASQTGALVDPFPYPLSTTGVSPFLSSVCIASEMRPSDVNSPATPSEIETICRSRKDLFTVLTEGGYTYIVARAKKVGGTGASSHPTPILNFIRPRFRYDPRVPVVAITGGAVAYPFLFVCVWDVLGGLFNHFGDGMFTAAFLARNRRRLPSQRALASAIKSSELICDPKQKDHWPEKPAPFVAYPSYQMQHVVPLEPRLGPVVPAPPFGYSLTPRVPAPSVPYSASSNQLYEPESDSDVTAAAAPHTSAVRLHNPNVIHRLNVLISRCPEGAQASLLPLQYESHFGEALDTTSIDGRKLKLSDVLKSCACRWEFNGTTLTVYPTIDPVGVPRPKRARIEPLNPAPAAPVPVAQMFRPKTADNWATATPAAFAPPATRPEASDTATYDIKVQRILDIVRKSQGVTASEIAHEYKNRYSTDLVLKLVDGTVKPLHKVLVGLKNVRFKPDKFERNVYTVQQ